MSNEPLDLLGRKLKVGDHVVYYTKGYGHEVNLLAGTIKDIDRWGRATIAPDPKFKGCKAVTKSAANVCAIVLPDIQDPEVQLSGEAPPVSALGGSA